MSEEDRELLARIGQLAGQINRHKNQQAGVSSAPTRGAPHYRHNSYRHSAAPYHQRGYRTGRPAGAHRHRTLQLNNSAPSTPSTASPSASTPDASGWVSKTDRHRQLINASVYEKESQNRAKAIEETRQRKLIDQRKREKRRIRQLLGLQNGSDPSATNPNPGVGKNELTINGIVFTVLDGGKKLARSTNDPNPTSATPKTAVVAGVKFHRTKTGNLVASRIVQTQRRSGVIKKVGERCKIFSTTGSCPKGPMCRYMHIPDKVAICRDFLKDGNCPLGASCDLSHDATPERVPNCLHYAKGNCTKPDCVYTHSKAAAGAPVCRNFGYYGFCDLGAECSERHVFECPDFSNTGVCKTKGCKLLHRERASVLRNQAKPEDMVEDVSSDDEVADSDDVDSDEVAEFIEAESDDSDFENPKEFLAI